MFTYIVLLVSLLDIPPVCKEVKVFESCRDRSSDLSERKRWSPKQEENPWLESLKGDEFLIDTNIVYGPAPGSQKYPSIAFDGTNYLVVWESGSDIYGARVNKPGKVLDTAGIAISTAAGDQKYPSVAFDGTNYLVVWTDRRGDNYDIYGARVSPSGEVLDAEDIVISTVVDYQWYPSLAFDGTNYLVVWTDERSGYSDIYGARVSPSGEVLDDAGIAISTVPDWQSLPSVAFDGTNYLVVWEDGRGDYFDIYGVRVSKSGEVLDAEDIAISIAAGYHVWPSVAFDGTNYLVVWEDLQAGADIYGARVSKSGEVLDVEGIAISTAADVQCYSSIAFDGTNYLVVWQDHRGDDIDIYGARVSKSGAVLDSEGIAISTAADGQWYPSIAFDSTNYFVAWQEGLYDISKSDIYGARISISGTVLDTEGIAISIAVNWQESPSVAFDGTNYLVVWTDSRGDDYEIYGARVSQSGTTLDPSCIAISTAPDNQCEPSVAFDGTNYLVVWTDSRSGNFDIYGARVSQTGTVLDTCIAISTAGLLPSVAFDGTNYLVVWTDTYSDIYGVRVSTSGTVLDTQGIAISTAAYWQWSPSVAYNGTNYFVVWQDERSGYYSDIYGARVSTSGQVLEDTNIAISTAANNQRSPSVAYDGTNYLVVWKDKRSGYYYDIYGARVTTSGEVLEGTGIAISTAKNDQYSPSVAFDGTNYLVVWQDNRGDDYDICGARVDNQGIVIDSFAVSTQAEVQVSPALARGSGNQVLITYSGWTPVPYSAMRIWGKLYPFTGVEEKSEVRSQRPEVRLMVYPNPFTTKTEIRFQISENVGQGFSLANLKVYPTLKIYDLSGRLIRSFPINQLTNQPINQIVWDGTDNAGKKVRSGVYFCKLEVGNYIATRKLIILR